MSQLLESLIKDNIVEKKRLREFVSNLSQNKKVRIGNLIENNYIDKQILYEYILQKLKNGNISFE